MAGLWRRLWRTGRIAQTVPTPPADLVAAGEHVRGSVQVRQVDAGSCNGCEIEIGSAFGPVYDTERYGVRLVASPRHADVLMVTGPVTRNMAGPLQQTFDAAPRPVVVMAVGDCARNCGEFAGGYGVAGAVSDVVPVDVEVAGCPPHPSEIAAALRKVSGR